MLTGIQLGYHRKPIVFLDVDGFWAPLAAFLDHAVRRRRAAPRGPRAVSHRAVGARRARCAASRGNLDPWPLAPSARCSRSWRRSCSRHRSRAAVAPKIVPGWWDGHPSRRRQDDRAQGHPRRLARRAAAATSASTCNCQELPTGTQRSRPIGLAELAAIGADDRDADRADDSAWTHRRSPQEARARSCSARPRSSRPAAPCCCCSGPRSRPTPAGRRADRARDDDVLGRHRGAVDRGRARDARSSASRCGSRRRAGRMPQPQPQPDVRHVRDAAGRSATIAPEADAAPAPAEPRAAARRTASRLRSRRRAVPAVRRCSTPRRSSAPLYDAAQRARRATPPAPHAADRSRRRRCRAPSIRARGSPPTPPPPTPLDTIAAAAAHHRRPRRPLRAPTHAELDAAAAAARPPPVAGVASTRRSRDAIAAAADSRESAAADPLPARDSDVRVPTDAERPRRHRRARRGRAGHRGRRSTAEAKATPPPSGSIVDRADRREIAASSAPTRAAASRPDHPSGRRRDPRSRATSAAELNAAGRAPASRSAEPASRSADDSRDRDVASPATTPPRSRSQRRRDRCGDCRRTSPRPRPAARVEGPDVDRAGVAAAAAEDRAESTGPTPACPQCEAPMAWVEEHLRFYCKQCRMYF